MSEPTYVLRLVKVTGEKEPVILWIVANLHIYRSKSSELVDHTPSMLRSGLSYSVADDYRRQLEALGAIVEIENST